MLIYPGQISNPVTQSAGYARTPSESANPGLWRDLVCYLSPAIGNPAGVMKDITGRGNNGTITGATYRPTEGVRGGGNTLHGGTPHYIQVADGADLKFGTGAFTVGIWAKTTDGGSKQVLNKGIGGIGHAYAANHFALSIDGGNRYRFTVATNGESSFISSGLFNGAWHLLVGVANPELATVTLYADGVSGTPDAYTVADITSILNLTIGADYDLGGLDYNGSIGDVFLWRRALSANEVMKLWTDPFVIIRPRRTVRRIFVPGLHYASTNELVYLTSQPSGDFLTSDPSGDFLVRGVPLIPAVTMSATATITKPAAAAITMPAVTMSVAMAFGRNAASAITVPAVTMLAKTDAGLIHIAVSDLTVSAVTMLSSVATNGVGPTDRYYREAAGAMTVGAVTGAGAATIARAAASAASVPAVAMAAAARIYPAKAAAGAPSVAAVAMSARASAMTPKTATGAPSVRAVTMAGVASYTTTMAAAGAPSVAAVIMSAAGAVQHIRTLSGAITVAAVSMSAASVVSKAAASAASVPAVTMAGEAAIVFQAVGAVTIPVVTMTGPSVVSREAASAASVPAVTMAGVAAPTNTKTGAGAMTLPAVTMAATGTKTVSLAVAMTVPAVTMAAATTRSYAETIALTVPGVTMSANARNEGDTEGQWYCVTHIEYDYGSTVKTLALDPWTKPLNE